MLLNASPLDAPLFNHLPQPSSPKCHSKSTSLNLGPDTRLLLPLSPSNKPPSSHSLRTLFTNHLDRQEVLPPLHTALHTQAMIMVLPTDRLKVILIPLRAAVRGHLLTIMVVRPMETMLKET